MQETTQLSFPGEAMETPDSGLWNPRGGPGPGLGRGQESRGGPFSYPTVSSPRSWRGQRRAHTDPGHRASPSPVGKYQGAPVPSKVSPATGGPSPTPSPRGRGLLRGSGLPRRQAGMRPGRGREASPGASALFHPPERPRGSSPGIPIVGEPSRAATWSLPPF